MSTTTSDKVKRILKYLPEHPGVYLMKDGEGTVIYIGKAKSLKNRVRSYFSSDHTESIKTRELVKRIDDIETIVLDSEEEALILEDNLIKRFRPKFNINLKDDKTYPYIKVTWQESFPRVFPTRRFYKDGAKYFGPYTDVKKMHQALSLLKELYPIRSCNYSLPSQSPQRACLDYHIYKCKAPCVGLQSEHDYRVMIEEVVECLSGNTSKAVIRLKEKMQEAAEKMEFEKAGALRDSIPVLDHLESYQKIVDTDGGDRDVLGIARDKEQACGVVLTIRDGKLIGRQAVFLQNIEDETDESILKAFVTKYYTSKSYYGTVDSPEEIVLPFIFDDMNLLQNVISKLSEQKIVLRTASRGDKARLLTLAEQNSRHLLEQERLDKDNATDRAPDSLYDLQESLSLTAVPRLMVCFDISHLQGTDVVASAVVFENGAPKKSEYRKFKIKGNWGNDDFLSMAEVVRRYFTGRIRDNLRLPDLVVIDGGKGQLGAAINELESLGFANQDIISLAKKQEEVFVPARKESIRLSRRSEGLKVLQQIRDEAHRFAITFNRSLRNKRVQRSLLSGIRGIGKEREQKLLKHFGSLTKVKGSSPEELAQVLNMKLERAKTLHADICKI